MLEILKRKAGPPVDPSSVVKSAKNSKPSVSLALPLLASPKSSVASTPEEDDLISPRHGEASDGKVQLHKQLIRAVRSNDVKGVVAALEAGSDPEIGSSSSATRPLHIAAKHGFAEVCQTLGNHGADVNCKTKNGWTPLHFAASAGSLEAVKALLRNGAQSTLTNELGRLPVELAREKGFTEVVGVLEDEAEGDPEVESPRDLVVSPDDDGTPDGKALCLAVRADNYEKVVVMLDAGVDPDWQSPDTKTSALHVCAKHGHTDVCDLLLERGASVNVQNKAGWTPMHYAASSGFFEMVEMLRSYGAHADILNKMQQSPVDLARSHGYSRIVDVLRNRPPRSGTTVQREKVTMAKEKMLSRAIFANDEASVAGLLDEGADVNWVNPTTSISPLHVAVKQGKVKMARLLLERGADANIQTKAGWTALHFAATKSDYEMATLLREFGARADFNNEWMKAPTDIAKDKKDDEMLAVLRRRPEGSVPDTSPRKSPKPSKTEVTPRSETPQKPTESKEPKESKEVVVQEPKEAKSSMAKENSPRRAKGEVSFAEVEGNSSPAPEAQSARAARPEVAPLNLSGATDAAETKATSPRSGRLSTKSPRASVAAIFKKKETGPLKRDDEQAKLVEELKKAKKKQQRKPLFFGLRKQKPEKILTDNRKSLPNDMAAEEMMSQDAAPDAAEPAASSPRVVEPATPVVAAVAVAATPEAVASAPKSPRSPRSEGEEVGDEDTEEKPKAVVAAVAVAAVAAELPRLSKENPPVNEKRSSEKRRTLERFLSHESVLALRGGIQRGQCVAPDCKCPGFSADLDKTASSMCSTCSHFPSQHQKLNAVAGAKPSPTAGGSSRPPLPARKTQDDTGVSARLRMREGEIRDAARGSVLLAARACTVSGVGVTGGPQSMEPVTCTLETIDNRGELWTTAESVAAIVRDPLGKKLRVKVFHVKPGRYDITYPRALAGRYTIDVTVNDQKAGASPYSVVATQVVAAKNCIAKGSALADGKRSEGVAIFSVELRDLVGDPFVGACSVVARVACNGMPVECKQRDQLNGTHTVEFLRSLIGSYSAEVFVNDEFIMGSPFAFNVSERKDVLAGRLVPVAIVVDDAAAAKRAVEEKREAEEKENAEKARREKERQEKEEDEERERERERKRREEAQARAEEEERQQQQRERERKERERQREEQEEREEEERRREQRRRREQEELEKEEEKRREEEELKRAEEEARGAREAERVRVERETAYDEVLTGEVGEEGESNSAPVESPRRNSVSGNGHRALSWEEKMAREDRDADARRLRVEKARVEEQERGRQDSDGRSLTPAQVRLSLHHQEQLSPAATNEGGKKKATTPGKLNRETTPVGQVPETGGAVLKYADIRGRKKHYLYSEEVNCNHLEAYLSAEEFEKVFGMDKTEFYGKPLWRRAELLKKVNLF
jgi:ankyrin repeat protein